MANYRSDMTEEDKPLENEGDTFHLADYLDICLKRMWLIGTLVLVMTVGTAFWSWQQAPIFESTAVLVFDAPAPRLMVELDMRITADNKELITQVALMKTFPVLAETVQRLDLGRYPEYQAKKPSTFQQMKKKMLPDWLSDLKGMLDESFVARPDDISTMPIGQEPGEFPDPVFQGLVRAFAASIRTENVRDSKLVKLTVQSQDPALAARAANTLSSVYIDNMQIVRTKAIEASSLWFTKHLHELREKVEQSEGDLHNYQAEHGLMGIGKRQNVTTQRLSLVNSELVEAEKQISTIESKMHLIERIRKKFKIHDGDTLIDKSDLYNLQNVLDSPGIRKIHNDEVVLSIKMEELSERFGALHPEITRLQNQRRALQSSLEKEVEQAHKLVKSDYELALQRKKAVSSRITKEKTQQLSGDRLSVKLSILEREANSNKLLYDSFFKRMKETDLSKEIKANKVYLAELAIPNPNPVAPRPLRSTLLALLLSLGMGVGLAFFLHYWDRSLKAPQDLEQYFPEHLALGWVPRIPGSRKKDLSRIIQSEPSSVAADCYRHLRTSVRQLGSVKSSTELLITSPSEQEGKTTLAVNLAIALTLLEGYKVVLIDGDLRCPRLHEIFGIPQQNGSSRGLTEYLSKKVEITEIFHQTDIPNLRVIPSGAWAAEHTELLDSERFTQLLEWCREHHIHVIVDGSPILTLSDSLVIASQVSDTILTVRAGSTNRASAKRALQKLTKHGVGVLGVVMQNVSSQTSELFSSKYYHRPYQAVSYSGPLKSLVNKTFSRFR